jgi:hypothetical protein
MVSPLLTSFFAESFVFANFLHAPGSAGASVVTPDAGVTLRTVDVSLFPNFAAMVALSARGVVSTGPTVLSAGITRVEIVASASPTMSSPVVVKDSGVVVQDAIGDTVFLECSDDDVQALGATYRYVAVRVTTSHADDQALAAYISRPIFPRAGLTAGAIS